MASLFMSLGESLKGVKADEAQHSNPVDYSLCSGLQMGSLTTSCCGASGESNLKTDNKGITAMFPSSHQLNGQSEDDKIHQVLVDGSKERWNHFF